MEVRAPVHRTPLDSRTASAHRQDQDARSCTCSAGRQRTFDAHPEQILEGRHHDGWGAAGERGV